MGYDMTNSIYSYWIQFQGYKAMFKLFFFGSVKLNLLIVYSNNQYKINIHYPVSYRLKKKKQFFDFLNFFAHKHKYSPRFFFLIHYLRFIFGFSFSGRSG